MKEKEFNLKEKVHDLWESNWYEEEDVKEFIRLLKEEIEGEEVSHLNIFQIIDKLSGGL